ncbi:MAG: periplasmic heavy metal sensor [Proteobacteria bacterium]|nr:periplasmic heavy metal sensor [Pseudomonadota bacterium]
MNRKALTIVVTTVAVLSLSAMAFAYGPGMGPGMGRGGCGAIGAAQTLTPEQQQQLDTLQNDFFARTETLRQETYAKHLELEALLAATKMDKGKIEAVTKQLVDLKGKMFQESVTFREKVREAGIQDFGRGRGFCGRSGQGKGATPGNCPGQGQGNGPRDGSGPCGGTPNCPGTNG